MKNKDEVIKEKSITIRVSPKFKQEIQDRADELKISMSSLINMAIVGYLKKGDQNG